jgi:hypothetical protein
VLFLIFVLNHSCRVRLIRPCNGIEPAYYRVTSSHQLIFESIQVVGLRHDPACLRPQDTLDRTWLQEIIDILHWKGATSDTLYLISHPGALQAFYQTFSHMWFASRPLFLPFLPRVRPELLTLRPRLSSLPAWVHLPIALMASQANIIDGTAIAKCVLLFFHPQEGYY